MHLLDHPHHDGSELYVGTARPALGELVTLRVRAPEAFGVRDVHLRATPDGEPRFIPAHHDGGEWWSVAVEVRNPVTNYRFYLPRRGRPPVWLTAAGIVAGDLPDDDDFRLVAYEAPAQWKRSDSSSCTPTSSASRCCWADPAQWFCGRLRINTAMVIGVDAPRWSPAWPCSAPLRGEGHEPPTAKPITRVLGAADVRRWSSRPASGSRWQPRSFRRDHRTDPGDGRGGRVLAVTRCLKALGARLPVNRDVRVPYDGRSPMRELR